MQLKVFVSFFSGAVSLFLGLFLFANFYKVVNDYLDFSDGIKIQIEDLKYLNRKIIAGGENAAGKYIIEVKYLYRINGKAYEGNRVSLHNQKYLFSSLDEMYHHLLLSKQENFLVYCYVKKKDPSESVLDRRPHTFTMLFQLFLCILGIGMGLYLFFCGYYEYVSNRTNYTLPDK